MINGQINANIHQIEACLKEYSEWGTRHIVDICTDKTYVVPWGIGDYLDLGTWALFLLLVLALVFVIIRSAYL